MEEPLGLWGYHRKYTDAECQDPAPRPLPDPMPLLRPLVVRRAPAAKPLDPPFVPCPPIGTYPGVEGWVVLVALPGGLPFPFCEGFGALTAASAFRLSSSARFAAAALRSCSSSSLRSAACCLA